MRFGQLPPAAAIFFDANTLVHHFTQEPRYGAACTQLVKQVEQQQFSGFTSTHALADVSHRLMTIEAMERMGWSQAGVTPRLRKHRHVIGQLSTNQQAISGFHRLGIQVLPVTQPLVEAAAKLTQQFLLLTGDALIVAVMQQHGLTCLASNDSDFDCVPGIIRYAPA
jgi:predicted nucleic acid-binding protein